MTKQLKKEHNTKVFKQIQDYCKKNDVFIANILTDSKAMATMLKILKITKVE
jgi:hypothetical protein